jgi:nitrate reductase gamma subunit
MIRSNSLSPARKTIPVLALLSLFALLPAAPSMAAEGTTVRYTKENQQEYEKQLAAGEIQSVTVNKRVRSLHLTLKDGRHMLFKYKAHEAPKYIAALQAKHVPVTILQPAQAAKEAKKPAKHKLRYIVGGILVAVVVVVGGVLLIDRRRKRAME